MYLNSTERNAMSRTLKSVVLGVLMAVVIGFSSGCSSDQGYDENEAPYVNPPADECSNIDGIQEEVPEGTRIELRFGSDTCLTDDEIAKRIKSEARLAKVELRKAKQSVQKQVDRVDSRSDKLFVIIEGACDLKIENGHGELDNASFTSRFSNLEDLYNRYFDNSIRDWPQSFLKAVDDCVSRREKEQREKNADLRQKAEREAQAHRDYVQSLR
jgi:hypothetical protein